jgi:hypothetical protein
MMLQYWGFKRIHFISINIKLTSGNMRSEIRDESLRQSERGKKRGRTRNAGGEAKGIPAIQMYILRSKGHRREGAIEPTPPPFPFPDMNK